MYIVLDKITGEIIHNNPAPVSQGLSGQDVYYLFDPDNHVIVTELPEFYKMADGMPVELLLSEKLEKGITVLDKSLKIVDENIVQKEPYEYMSLDEFRDYSIKKIKDSYEDNIAGGFFHSSALGIKADCRRAGTKNDLQNVQCIISFMKRTFTTTIDYTGYDSIKAGVTLSMLKRLASEMGNHFLSLYEKKRGLISQADRAVTIEELKAVEWI